MKEADQYDKMPANAFRQIALSLRNKRKKRERKFRRKLREFLANETSARLEYTYREHLKSKQWRYFAKSVIRDRGCMCERCGRGDVKLTVHHISYVRLGHELPEDVKVYCWPCHRTMHPEKDWAKAGGKSASAEGGK